MDREQRIRHYANNSESETHSPASRYVFLTTFPMKKNLFANIVARDSGAT
jgi:hypothetical protein